MSPLDGGIAAQFASIFGPLYLDATLHRPAAITYDAGGSIIPAAGTTSPCKAQVDGVTYAMRQAEGFVDGDVRIFILADTVDGPVTTDHRVEMNEGPHAGLYSIQSTDRDPAGAYWDCRGRRA